MDPFVKFHERTPFCRLCALLEWIVQMSTSKLGVFGRKMKTNGAKLKLLDNQAQTVRTNERRERGREIEGEMEEEIEREK